MSFLPSLSPSARAQTTPFSDRKKSVFATLPIPAVEEIDRNKSLREDNWRSKLFALDDDYIDTSLDLDPNKSKWHAQASIVKNRPRGWLQRFAVNLDESNIRIPPPTPTEQRERRLQEVGWTNIKVQRSSIALCVDDDEEETPEQNTALIAYPQLAPKLKSCCYCCLGVPTGAEYVGCRSCNVVSHINCLPDIDNYIKPEHLGKIQNPVGVLRTQRSAVAGSKRLQFAMPKDHSQSSRTLLASSRPRSSPLTASGNISLVTSNNLTASCLMWTCQFCSFERQAYVDTKAEMQEQQRQRCKLLRCAVTIQAFCRMVTERIRYQKFLRGLRMLQNIIRMRRLVEKSEVDRANKRYTYRLRLHDIKMIVDNSTLDSIGGSHAPHHSYSSSTSAAHATPSTAFPHLPKPYVVGELNSVTYDKFFGPTKVQAAASDVKDQDLLDFINEGYTEPGNNYAKSYRNIQVLPKGTLFVTVSVHEYLREGNGEGGAYRRPVQLCRYDLLLKEEIKVQRLRPIHLQKLGYKHLSGPELERACRQYSMLSFSLAKPYLLIPYSRANAELKLTLSEVQDWPKAEVKGQCAFNIAYYVTRHRVVSMVQSLGSCSFSDLPAQEEGGKLNLVMSRAPVSPSSSPTRPVSRLMRDTAASRGGSAELEAGRGGRKKKGGREYSHALLSWTLITMGYSEVNEVGFLMTLNQEAVSSTKKKHWCILLDKTLYIYNVVRDNIQLKFVYDIKSAYVQLLSNDVFRVKFSTETLYFLSLTKREHETWFRKIYSQSLSHMSVPYHVYVKKRLPARMSFTTKAMVGSQDGAMSSSQGVVKKSSAVNLSVNTNLPVSTSYSYMLEDKPFVPISPTRSTPARRRTSMEEVELMSTEVDAFLERMSQQYLQLKASNIPKLGAISKRQAAASPRRQVPSSSHRAVSVPKNVGTSVQSFVNTVNIGGTMGLGVGVDVGGNEGDFKEYISKHREESLYTPLIKEVNSEAQAAVEIGKLDRKASTVGRKERATMLDNFAATIINSRNIFM